MNSYDVARLPIDSYAVAIFYSFLRYKCMQHKKEDFSTISEDKLLPNRLAAQSLVYLFCCEYADLLHEPCCNEDFIATEEGPINKNVENTLIRFSSKVLIELKKKNSNTKKKNNIIEEYFLDATEAMNKHLLSFINISVKKYSKYENDEICKEAKNTLQYQKARLNKNYVISHDILLEKRNK